MFDGDFELYGKHATYLKMLCKSKDIKSDANNEMEQEKVEKPFNRYIDVYMNAAVWGLLYKTTAERDNTSKDRARIYADAFQTEKENCVFLYRLVMLLDQNEKEKISQEERVDRAFRYDTQEDKKDEFTRCMERFNSYVRGGIELLYDHLVDGCTTKEDYLERMIETVQRFHNSLEEPQDYEREVRQLLEG